MRGLGSNEPPIGPCTKKISTPRVCGYKEQPLAGPVLGLNELLSKLLVSPLITPIVVPYIIPYITTPFKEFRL